MKDSNKKKAVEYHSGEAYKNNPIMIIDNIRQN